MGFESTVQMFERASTVLLIFDFLFTLVVIKIRITQWPKCMGFSLGPINPKEKYASDEK
jgi:hypothetical protein